MNPIVKPVALALLAIVTANTVFAAPAATDAPSRVEVIVHRADLAAAQAVLGQREFETTYLMSTGRRLDVRAANEGLRVRYGRRAPATLSHDGQGRFVSADGQLALRFELDADGDAQLVRLSLPAEWQ